MSIPPEGRNVLALVEGSSRLWAKTVDRLNPDALFKVEELDEAVRNAKTARNLAMTAKCECRMLMADAACTAEAKTIYTDLFNRSDLIHARINEKLGDLPVSRKSITDRARSLLLFKLASGGALVGAAVYAAPLIKSLLWFNWHGH